MFGVSLANFCAVFMVSFWLLCYKLPRIISSPCLISARFMDFSCWILASTLTFSSSRRPLASNTELMWRFKTKSMRDLCLRNATKFFAKSLQIKLMSFSGFRKWICNTRGANNRSKLPNEKSMNQSRHKSRRIDENKFSAKWETTEAHRLSSLEISL